MTTLPLEWKNIYLVSTSCNQGYRLHLTGVRDVTNVGFPTRVQAFSIMCNMGNQKVETASPTTQTAASPTTQNLAFGGNGSRAPR